MQQCTHVMHAGLYSLSIDVYCDASKFVMVHAELILGKAVLTNNYFMSNETL